MWLEKEDDLHLSLKRCERRFPEHTPCLTHPLAFWFFLGGQLISKLKSVSHLAFVRHLTSLIFCGSLYTG